MTTQKQIIANRKNANKSTGAKTEEGKEIIKLNALKHGLLSKEVLLDIENVEELVNLGKKIRLDLNPSGEIELVLAERIISNIWRLKRVLRVEKAIMEKGYDKEKNRTRFMENNSKKTIEDESLAKMLTNQDIDKLTRYEISIERSMYKAIHELQRIQSAKVGEKPIVPIAIDLDVAS